VFHETWNFGSEVTNYSKDLTIMTTFKNLKEATAAYNTLEARLQALEARMDLSAKLSKKLIKITGLNTPPVRVGK
jgi:hypothetical protein